MSLQILPARPEDAPLLVRLIRGLAEYENLLDRVVVTEDQLRAELFCDRPVVEAVIGWLRVAEPDGSAAPFAAGFALFFHNFSTFLGRRGLYLEDLFVVPQARGQGIGKALVRYGARLAVARDCGRYEWTVLDWNAPAIAFYQALGAEVMPDWRLCRSSGAALQRMAQDAPAPAAARS
jgi:hypothetical protein